MEASTTPLTRPAARTAQRPLPRLELLWRLFTCPSLPIMVTERAISALPVETDLAVETERKDPSPKYALYDVFLSDHHIPGKECDCVMTDDLSFFHFSLSYSF